MKKLLCISMAIVAIACYSQQAKENTLTNAELFSSKAGTLIERQFIDVGKVKDILVRVLIYKDLNSNVSQSALRFEYVYSTSYTVSTKIAALDVDEIDGLIKSIKNIQNNVFSTTRDVYTEITFRSKTGFEAGAYYNTDKNKWSTYVQLEKYDTKSMVFLTIDEFNALVDLIIQAKAKI